MLTKKEINSIKSAIRKASRYRKTVNEARKRCKIVLPTGEYTKATKKKPSKPKTLIWNVCEFCHAEQREPLEIDHIVEINKFPKLADGSPDWNTWIPKVLCELTNLQCLCTDCHKEKTRLFNTGEGAGEYYL